MADKELIYFPSLSTFTPNLKKDLPLINDFSFRFYDKAAHGDFHHPYFLLTAGALYKKKNIRHQLGMDDSLVFGDSGGFQIATGALKWDVKLREDIFKWLEGNSDIAMNIDIPPTQHLKNQGIGFRQCLDMTIDNMQWFEKHQTGKTDFLNVLQIYDDEQTKIWYDGVKHFDQFTGWGIGSANATVVNFCKIIKDFLLNKEFEKKSFKWFHFLGKTSVAHFFLYSVLQRKLNEYYPHVQITTDSSTPALQAVYGNWYHSVNYKDLNFVNLYYGNKGKTKYIDDREIPCVLGCPMCNNLKFGNYANDGSNARFYIAYHNLWAILQGIKDINQLTQSHFEILQGMIPTGFHQILGSIIEMFDSGAPEVVFEKYKDVYSKFDKRTANKSQDFSGFDDVFQDWKNGGANTEETKAVKEQQKLINRIELGLPMMEEDEDDNED